MSARDPEARWLPSPNFQPGRQAPVECIILHGTFSVTEARSLDYLLRSRAPNRVSSHYLICYSGEILQLVDEVDTAWHAGRSAWGGRVSLNACSIGIEISNRGPEEPYAAVQLDALEGLLGRILRRWEISMRLVLGHSDVATGRKVDPGEHFPWARLEDAGLAAPWAAAGAGADPIAALRAWGWCGADADVVRAFQRRYLRSRLDEGCDTQTARFIQAGPGRW